ncbi:hypothetical protein B4W74_12930 [Staphylococcus intermedius]|uniref:hypothetical protein n=1 Tax=Staphylococcus intermedius TaxID=1285 RepID=UPI000BBC4445|nr:hypothetical protein [Staphylococcus intermedius]PCF77628.1 hypothetical protein B4W74_12930 [Staphylococcus intermedius]
MKITEIVTSYWFSLFVALMFATFSTSTASFTNIQSIGEVVIFAIIFIVKVSILFLAYKIISTLIVKVLS